MSNSWLAFKADYFELVCREVFDEYLGRHGFARGEADKIGSPTYFREDFFLRPYYYVEDSPQYSPMVNIGLRSGALPHPAFNQIGLWYAVPPESDAREYGLWSFSNAEELKQVLTRVRDEVVEVYARPLWNNPEKLERLIERCYREVMAEQEVEVLEKGRAEAEQAFRAHDYHKAALLYSAISESDLSPAERKRYELSKRYIS